MFKEISLIRGRKNPLNFYNNLLTLKNKNMVKLTTYTETELKKFDSKEIQEKHFSILDDVMLIKEDIEILNYIFLIFSTSNTPNEIVKTISDFRDEDTSNLKENFKNVKIEITSFEYSGSNSQKIIIEVYNKEKNIISINFRYDL